MNIDPDGGVAVRAADGPPPDLPGVLIGFADMATSPPHGGERHPDGDEVLWLLDGDLDIVLDHGDRTESFHVEAGEAFVIPRGVWHRVVVEEPVKLLYLTPGPGSEARPLDS